MSYALAFLWLTVLLLVGWAFVRVLFSGAGKLHAALWLPISFAMGIGVFGFALTVLLVVPGFWNPLLLFWFLAILWAGLWLLQKGREDSPEFGGFELLEDGNLWRRHRWVLGLGGVVLLFCALNFTNAVTFPFTSYDGRAIWNYKAMILYEEGTVHSDAFTDPLRVHYHRDYPLAVPAANLGVMKVVGGNNERAIRMFYSAVFLYQALFLFGALRRLGVSAPLAALGMLFFSGMAFRNDWNERDGNTLNSGSADFPLALMVSIGAFLNVLWWKERERWQFVGTAVFMGFCMLLKAEGLLLVAALGGANGLAWLCAGSGNRGTVLRSLLAMATVLAVVVLPWFPLKQRLPNIYDESYTTMLRADILPKLWERVPVIIGGFQTHLFDWSRWGYFWPVFLGVPVLAALTWHWRGDYLLDWMLGLWLLGVLVVYTLSPLDLRFHISTSLNRLLSQVAPLFLLRVFMFVQDRAEWVKILPSVTPQEVRG